MNPHLKEIANFIDFLSKKELFNCLALGPSHLNEFKANFTSVNSYLKTLATHVRSTGNEVAKKDKIATMVSLDGMYAKAIINTQALFNYRSIWLPMEHMEIKSRICADTPRMKGAERRYFTIQDYVTNYLKIDYTAINEEQKKLAEIGFARAIIEDSLNPNGIDRLAAEDKRFYAVTNLIPQSLLNEYTGKVAITDNPFDFVVEILKLYATGYTITASTQYEVLDI